MPANRQEELVQGSQPSESEVQGRGPGLGGPRAGEGRNRMQIVCLFLLSWVQDPHQIPREAWDPRPGGLLVRGVGLLRKGLGRVSGQALVFHFPSVNTRKPHPELQTDIQKSILNCRLRSPQGPNGWKPRTVCPGPGYQISGNFHLSLSEIATADVPAAAHWS